MRFVVIILCVIAIADPVSACPIRPGGKPSPCGKLLKDQYMTSTIYMRSVHAKPPEFDQVKSTKFITAATWAPLADLDRRSFEIVYRNDKEVTAPTLRFVDPATIKTSPKSTKRMQLVLVREVEGQVDGMTLITVDDEKYLLLACRRGKRVSSCLVKQAEIEAWKRRKQQIIDGKL